MNLKLLASFSFFTEKIGINILLVVAFILFLIISALLASTETAFSNSNAVRLRVFLEENKRGARKAVKISEDFERAQITIWISKSINKISAIVIAGYFISQSFDNIFLAILITFAFMSFVDILFLNFLPKQKALHNPEKIALKNAGFVYIFYRMSLPFASLGIKLKKTFAKESEQANIPKVTEEELESIIDTMETEGVFDEEDAELIQSAIALNERTVSDIMTPRVDIVAINEDMTYEQIKDVFFEHQFSRIPVYREDKDNIIGILSEKDFFRMLLKTNQSKRPLNSLMSKPLFVSESTKVYDLIKEFQKLKKHLAIVVDEYGGTSGIVTMEDALEELVGEIYDEYDEEELDDLVEISDNYYLISPEMELEDLFEYLEIDEVPTTQYNTVGGFVYSLIGGLPTEGKSVSYIANNMETEEKYDLDFLIKEVINKRIRLLELKVSLITNEEDDKEKED